ncbi:MAG: PASTA domain-containing protein [Thermoanaerobaculia bacterium]
MLYAIALAAVLVTATWVSFSRFVVGKSLRVPDLTNLTFEEATALAAERGLSIAVDATKESFDDKVPAHRILGQNPGADIAVKSGQRVRVAFSLGPRTIRVPDLTGLSQRTAGLALVREGLQEGAVAAVKLPGPAGLVAQGVLAGTTATPQTKVDVLVNRGNPDVAYVMPDLIGRDFDRIRLAFEVRGFRLGGVKSQAYEGAASGTILRQFPPAGFPVTTRDTLSFVVAAPEPTAS